MPRSRPGVCGRLYTETRGTGGTSRVQSRVGDVCKLPAGHEGPHHGAHTGVHWTRNDRGIDMVAGWDSGVPHHPKPWPD